MIFYFSRYLIAISLFLLIFFATGKLIDRFSFSKKGYPLNNLVQIILGMVFWIYLVFTVAACQIFYQWVIYLLAGLIFAAFIFFTGKDLRKRGSFEAFPSIRLAPDRVFWALTLLGVLFYLFVQVLYPRITGDGQNYHLLMPKMMTLSHGFAFIPFKPITNWPLNVEMLFAAAWIVWNYILAKLVHFLIGGLLLTGVYFFTKEVHSRFAAMLAVILLFMNDVVLRVMVVSYSDLGIALFFFFSFWFVTKSLNEPEKERGYLILAGIFCGAMAGCKLNGFMGGLVLGILYLGVKIRHKDFHKSFGKLILYFGTPAILLLLPWLIKSAILTSNPVYPFMYDIFGGPQWDKELTTALIEGHMKIGQGREIVDYLLLPKRLIFDCDWTFPGFGGIIRKIWAVLIPFTLIFGIKKRIVRWGLFASLLYFITWAMGTQQMRHFISMLALLSFCGAISIAEGISLLKNQKAIRWAKAVMLIGASIYLLYAVDTAMVSQKARGRYQGPPLHWNSARVVGDVTKFINANTPKDAKLLYIGKPNTLFVQRESISNNIWRVPQITRLLLNEKTPEKLAKKLKKEGFTHIVLQEEKGTRAFGSTKTFRKLLKDDKLCRRIYKKDKHRVYKLL